MLFSILCNDKPNSLQIRLDTRTVHLDYLTSLGEAIVLAGPFLDADGKSNGSLIIVKADSLQHAQEMANNDPYALAGLFETSEVRQWNWTVKKPEHV